MMTRCLTIFLTMAFLTGLALSQSGSQNSSIPDCVRACDVQAIKASDCSSEDQFCHCLPFKIILSSIIPCIQQNSSRVNGTADLLSKVAYFSTTSTAMLLTVTYSFRVPFQRRLSTVQSFFSDEFYWQCDEDPHAVDAVHKSSFRRHILAGRDEHVALCDHTHRFLL
jgi:hypothetical protein